MKPSFILNVYPIGGVKIMNYKQFVKMSLIAVFLFSVVGCTSEKPTNEPTQQNEQQENQNKDNVDQETNNKEVNKLPEEKDLEVTVEGNTEIRKAILNKSDQGYSIYSLPNFTFSAEEPGKDILFFDNDGNYFVRIEKLPTDVNIEDLRANAETELKLLNEVNELKDEEIFDEYFRKAEFFLHASTSEVSKNIIVMDINGEIFKYTMHMSNGEAAEGVLPSFFAMLKTIEQTNE